MKELVQAVCEHATDQQTLARQAEKQYVSEVDDILRKKDRSPRHIEHLLDGILDFCFEKEILNLYK